MHNISLSSIMRILPLSSSICFSHFPIINFAHSFIAHYQYIVVYRIFLHAIFINPPIHPSSLTCLLPLNRAPCWSHGSLLILQRCVPLFVHLVVSPPPVCNRRSSVYRLSVPIKPVRHRMLYSYTQIATVGVNGRNEVPHTTGLRCRDVVVERVVYRGRRCAGSLRCCM